MKNKKISIKELTLERFKFTSLYEEANETEKRELLKALNFALCFPSSTTPICAGILFKKDIIINKTLKNKIF